MKCPFNYFEQCTKARPTRLSLSVCGEGGGGGQGVEGEAVWIVFCPLPSSFFSSLWETAR